MELFLIYKFRVEWRFTTNRSMREKNIIEN